MYPVNFITNTRLKARRALAGENVAATAAAPQRRRDPEVLRQARGWLETAACGAPVPAQTIGVDVAGISTAAFRLSDIIAQAAGPVTGVRARHIEASSEFVIRDVRVAAAPASDHRAADPAPIRILFLAANPRDTALLRLGEEVRAIDEALRLAENRQLFDLKQAHAVRVSDLQQLLMRCDPDIVHFSGHGSAAGEIILEDDLARMQPVAIAALARSFALLQGRIRCVVLNACFSLHQARAIAEHIGCVVGMTAAVGDAAAIKFAAAFYGALGYGRDLKTAFELGRNRIELEGLGEQDVPQLVMNKNYRK